MPLGYRRKARRFAGRRGALGRTAKRRRISVRRGRYGNVIAPKAAVSAIKRIVRDNALEPRYTEFGIGPDWAGFSIDSVNMANQQEPVVSEIFGLTLPDGMTLEATKEGLRIRPKRLDLYFAIQWQSRMGTNLQFGNNGKFPPPYIYVELMVCQMRAGTFATNLSTQQEIPTGAQMEEFLYSDATWAGRKHRPMFFAPTTAAGPTMQAMYRVLYRKTYKIRNPFRPPPVHMFKVVVSPAGVPTSLIDGGSSTQPAAAVNGTGTTSNTALSKMYKSIPLPGAKELIFERPAGADVDQVSGRMFFATRWWHPSATMRVVAADGSTTEEDAYEPPSCNLHHRCKYSA